MNFTCCMIVVIAVAHSLPHECPVIMNPLTFSSQTVNAISLTTYNSSIGDDVVLIVSITNLQRIGFRIALANRDAFLTIRVPLSAILPKASSTEYSFLVGWVGRVTIGQDFELDRIKIETSFVQSPDIDVNSSIDSRYPSFATPSF